MGYNEIKVLLVEDNERACYEFRKSIENWDGFFLVEATGKQSEAIDILLRKEIDAIILDLELEEGDGISFLEEMNHRVMEERPFIIVTTNTQSQTILHRVRHLGADFVYQKTNLNYSTDQILDFIKKSIRFHTPVKEENAHVSNREYMQAKENEMFKRYVATTLAGMGFVASYKGTGLIRDAIIMVAKTDNLVQITKHIYPLLGKKYGMTVNSVEKNIRTAIEQTWLNGDKEKLESKYPFAINNESGRPTNMNFICNMAELMKNRV